MTASDKALKDSVFHAYYRHYNDGDFKSIPFGTLKRLGLSDGDADRIKRSRSMHNEELYKQGMEKAAEVVTKYLLKKYGKDFNRQGTWNKKKKEIADNIFQDGRVDGYWVKEYGQQFHIPELIKLGEKLQQLNKGVSYTKDIKTPPEIKKQVASIVYDDLKKTV